MKTAHEPYFITGVECLAYSSCVYTRKLLADLEAFFSVVIPEEKFVLYYLVRILWPSVIRFTEVPGMSQSLLKALVRGKTPQLNKETLSLTAGLIQQLITRKKNGSVECGKCGKSRKWVFSESARYLILRLIDWSKPMSPPSPLILEVLWCDLFSLGGQVCGNPVVKITAFFITQLYCCLSISEVLLKHSRKFSEESVHLHRFHVFSSIKCGSVVILNRDGN